MDRLQETGRTLGRAAVALACATTLTLSGPARAQEPEGGEGGAASTEATENLNSQAEKHAIKAVQHFNNGAYVDAEEEFRRVAYFVPNWRPLHYNLAVLAEAQGKIGTAVSEYKAFRPFASSEEQLIADQRIDELGRRKSKIAGAYKRQIALSATALTMGVGGMAGGGVLLFLAPKEENTTTEKNFRLGGIVLVVYGLLAAVYSVVPLRKAVQSKRQLDGLALGPTRLRWTGGAGVQLRF